MAEIDNASILRRKIGAQSRQSEISGMTARKALRLAAARAAQDMVSLEVAASGCIESRIPVEDVVAACSGPELMLLLEGPERALGLARIDPQVVAGVVEHLTTGRVVPSEASAREATRTDAMMVSDLLDGMLAAFDGELAQMPDAPPASGFHHLVVLEDARAVMMALEDIPYRQFELALDLGGGAKSGEITLCFPYDPPRKSNYRTREFNDWHDKWRGHVLELPAPIEAIIHRVAMPVNEVTAREVGSLTPVPLSKISAISVEGADGHSVATGKLGQAAGFRAVRITSEVRASGAAEINAQAGNLNIVPEARLGPADATQEKHESVVQNVQMTPESAVESDPAESLDLPQTV